MYYESREPEQEPAGCLDVALVLRAVAGIIAWPLLVLLAIVLLIGATVYLFAVHPALALIPVAAIVAGVVLFARWEQRHFRPPGL